MDNTNLNKEEEEGTGRETGRREVCSDMRARRMKIDE